MAVLSACDSARGRIGAGEGLIGIAWALFVAGVPTTVASQWAVPSNSTAKLMVALHKNVVGGFPGGKLSRAEAWRRAALGMIGTKPYYWAGFVVVGYGGR
jgi:CHAT domain-containing protein